MSLSVAIGICRIAFYAPGGTLADLLRLDRFQALGMKRYKLDHWQRAAKMRCSRIGDEKFEG